MEHLELAVRTLEQILAREGDHLPPRDYLSVDTRGAELEVLRDGGGTLERHALAVFVGVRFAPTYEGQPISLAVEAYLQGRGVRLASLEVFEAKA